jgi:UDP-4-amino-4,6-dideoxy-N-acetyl-beta-L-altrosamine N-acetyltransferase
MRVELRDVQVQDCDRLLAWRNSPDVRRYMYTDHEISRDEHERWFYALAGRRYYWIIEADGVPVGLVNLADVDFRQKRAAWAFYIGDLSKRGAGIGSAVEREIISTAFDEMRLEKLTCEVLATNEAVCRLHEKHGFKREGVLRGHVIKDGQRVDVITYGLLASERPRFEAPEFVPRVSHSETSDAQIPARAIR